MDDKNQLIRALDPIVSRVRTDVTAKKGSKGQVWTRDPLTPALLAHHVNGGPARGVCPIKAGESVTMVGLLDLDSHKGESTWDEMAQAAIAVCTELEARFMAPVCFRSSGGRGIHIYVLWDEPQDAYSVRQELMEAIGVLGFSNGTGGVKHGEIEVFPKQDSVAIDGFGNQFILPLAGKSEPLDARMQPMGKDAAVGLAWYTSAPVPVREKPVRTESETALVDRSLAERALKAIPNGVGQGGDRDWWLKILCAAKEAGCTQEVAREWSSEHPSHVDEFFDKTWESITVGKDGGVRADYLLSVAHGHGFVEHIQAAFDPPEPDQPGKPNRKGIPEAKHLVTDLANASRVMRKFGKRLIVVAGQWYTWTGKRWERDEGEVYRFACTLSKIIHHEADQWRVKPASTAEEKDKNSGIADALTKWASKSEMKGAIEAAVGLAKKMLAVSEDMIDRDPWSLNCNNGTVDLRTGQIRPHDPEDYITKLVPVDYDPQAQAPTWERVLARVTLEEGMATRPVARFLQRWFGYCATGSTREQQFVVHHARAPTARARFWTPWPRCWVTTQAQPRQGFWWPGVATATLPRSQICLAAVW